MVYICAVLAKKKPSESISNAHQPTIKKQMEPTFRCGTRKAIDALVEELNLPNDLTMQDWSYESGKSK